MKLLILSSMTGLLLISCINKATKFPYNTRLPDGYYENWAYTPTLYLKISHDTAFADFMIIEKFPRSLSSDTLFYEPSGKNWKSNNWMLLQSGAYYELSPIYSDGNRHKALVRKIRTNKLLNKQTVDRNKNYAFVNLEQSRYQKGSNNTNRFYQIKQKYAFFDSLDIMSHEQLLISFKKFREELYKE